jgi:hypothetical protein
MKKYWFDHQLSDRLNDISIDITYRWAEQVNDDQCNNDDQDQDKSVFENTLTHSRNPVTHGK